MVALSPSAAGGMGPERRSGEGDEQGPAFVEFETGVDECFFEVSGWADAGSDADGAVGTVECIESAASERIDAGTDDGDVAVLVHGQLALHGPTVENRFSGGEGQLAD
jgi:hypothetical protein